MKRMIGVLIITLTLLLAFVLMCIGVGLKDALVAWGIVLLLTGLFCLGAWLMG